MTAPDAPFPKTAAASAGDFQAVFERCLSDGAEAIVCVDVAGTLSGTIKAATIARDALPDREIHVVDSGSASMGEGLLAQVGAEMAARGAAVEGAPTRHRAPDGAPRRTPRHPPHDVRGRRGVPQRAPRSPRGLGRQGARRRLPGRAVGGPAPGAGRDRRGRPLRGLIGSDVGLGPTRLVVPGTTKWLQRAGLMPRGASTMTMEPC